MEGIFEVEGMTLLSWTTRIAARDEADARELAQRLGQRTQAPVSAVKVDTLGHRVASCRPSTSRGGTRMTRFRIEGTTLVSWTQLVEAGGEEDASRLACQGFAALGVLGHEVTLDAARHRVVGCRRLETFVLLPSHQDGSGARRRARVARSRQAIRHSL
ncbi:MAG: hypothetical protein ACM3PV_02325 [Betaproteobacteria bacterium]